MGMGLIGTTLFDLKLTFLFLYQRIWNESHVYQACRWQWSISKTSFDCLKEGAYSNLIVSNQEISKKYKNAEICIAKGLKILCA